MGRGFPTGTARYSQKKFSKTGNTYFQGAFLAVLSGVAPDFPQFLWDLLLVQTEMTLKFLRQSTFNRKISAWE